MTDRVTVGNLRVAQVLYDFVNDEALPGTGLDPDTFWSGVDKVVADLTPKNQDLLARRDDLQAQHRQVAPPARHRADRPRGVQAVPHRDRLPAARARGLHDHHRGRRRRDHHDSGSAAGRPDPERAIRAQRGQRPVGLAVRRAVRHRRHPRGRRRREGAAELQQGPRRQGHRLRPSIPRRRRAAGHRRVERRDRHQDRRRPAADHVG